MANGKQLAEQNLGVFNGWISTKSDADFRQLVIRGVLSRTEIARECGFAKSALSQNPRIKEALRMLEDDLRARGVLPEVSNQPGEAGEGMQSHESGHLRTVHDTETLRQLYSEIASQKDEVAKLRQRLVKFEALHEALVLTGRLPR